MVNDVFAGQYHSVFKGQGMEFHEVREYQPGDDIRSIDWNVTARTGHPFIKKFTEEREMTVILLVDISASHLIGSDKALKKDVLAEIAAVLAFSATQNSDRVGLILFTDHIELYVPPAKGLKHVLRIIREVLYFEPRGSRTRLVPAFEFLNRVATRKTTSFILSDFITDEDFDKAVMITAKRHDLTALLLHDPLETSWVGTGIIPWKDAETGEVFLIDTSSRKVRQAIASQWIHDREHLLKKLGRSGVDTIEVSTGEPYEKALIKFFRMRERRRRT